MPNLSLLRQHSPLADPVAQRQILAEAGQAGIPEFAPTGPQLARVVVHEDDTWRARGGGRQIQRMRKGELVRIPERFRGTF